VKNRYWAMLAVLSLQGCANVYQATPIDKAAAEKPLYCDPSTTCAEMWRRAQVWLASNARYRLALVTDAVINTHGPARGEMAMAYQVTRESAGAGRDRIRVWAGCGNQFACDTPPDAAVAQLKRAIDPTH